MTAANHFDRWTRPAARPLVLGHRGARHAAPENTLAAFQLALDEGADGVELDVRLDGSGRVIVLHDRTLSRVTGGANDRDVERVGARELAACDLGRGERVPLLADVLAWARDRRTRVNVELKHDVSSRPRLVRGVLRAVADSGLDGESLIYSSFDPAIVFALGRLSRRVPSAWLVHDGQRLLRYAPGHALLRVRAIHPQRTLASAARVARWKRAGLLVNVWTVNEPAEAEELARSGVDALISDNPGRLLEALEKSPRGGRAPVQRSAHSE